MDKLTLLLMAQGAIVSFNTQKGFDEIQRIDNIQEYGEGVGITLTKQLENDKQAKVVASMLGYEFNDVDNPYKVTGVPSLKTALLTKGDTKVVLDISTLFTIYNAAFEHGVNEGPFPKNGTFDAFHKLLEGKPREKGGSFYTIADKINLAD